MKGLPKKAKKKLKEMLPWTGIGYDLINHSLEVLIEPEHFNEKETKKHIKYIRKIIGDEIDLTISQMAHPEPASCIGPNSECEPMVAGINVQFPFGNCTLGFKATLNGKPGFVTAGHCVVPIFSNVGQPTLQQIVGRATRKIFIDNGDCDCAFVEITSGRGIDPEVLGDFGNNFELAGTGIGFLFNLVQTVGARSGEGSGRIVRLNFTAEFTNGICIAGTTETRIRGLLLGDSGAPLFKNNVQFLGTLSGIDLSLNGITSRREFYIPHQRYTAPNNFGSSFSWDFN